MTIFSARCQPREQNRPSLSVFRLEIEGRAAFLIAAGQAAKPKMAQSTARGVVFDLQAQAGGCVRPNAEVLIENQLSCPQMAVVMVTDRQRAGAAPRAVGERQSLFFTKEKAFPPDTQMQAH